MSWTEEYPWLVVPCQRTRLDHLRQLVTSLAHPYDRVVVVTDDVNVLPLDLPYVHFVRRDPEVGINLAAWWNVGLDYVADYYDGDQPYEVAVLTSDVVGRPDSLRLLAARLRRDNWSMIGPNLAAEGDASWTLDQQRTVLTRVPAECFMLAGELGLRADERLRWWYADDDLEMQARQRGPVGIIGGTGLRLAEPSTELSAEQQRWAVEGRELFARKWNRQPW